MFRPVLRPSSDKNLTKEGIIKIPPIYLKTKKGKFNTVCATHFVRVSNITGYDLMIFDPSYIAKCRQLYVLRHAVITNTLFYQNQSTVMFTWGFPNTLICDAVDSNLGNTD